MKINSDEDKRSRNYCKEKTGVGIKKISWQQELKQALLDIGIESELYTSDSFLLLKFQDNDELYLNLLSIANHPGSVEA